MLGDLFTKPTQGSLFRKKIKFIINLWTDNLFRYDKKRSQECVVSTDPTYKRWTQGSMPHPEPRRCSDVVSGQDGIRPGPSMTQDVLRPGPSKDLTRVGIRPD